jgi:hypothetical protein
MAGQMARGRTTRGPLTRWLRHGACLGLMMMIFIACATGQHMVTVGASSEAVQRAIEIAQNQSTTTPEILSTIAGR